AEFEGRDDLATSFVAHATARLVLDEEQKKIVEELAVDWAQSFSREFLSEKIDAIARAGVGLGGTIGMPITRSRVAGKNQLAFYRALHDRLPAGSDLAGRVRATALVVLPLKRRK
ncbi:MAG: hypothetical protein GY946_22060, partial [bacterium]|nr:hypothetical protein [bacterium]